MFRNVFFIPFLLLALFPFILRPVWGDDASDQGAEKTVKVVAAVHNQTVDPKQSMTVYGVSQDDLNTFLPGPASQSTSSILQLLPGVQTYNGTGGFALSMPGGPHIRGGSGMGTVYALDGIPLNNNTLFNDSGNVGLSIGLSSFQFYPGVYPAQYGNGIDGYQNTVVPEGFGELHGRAQFSYGFWLDPGENAPIFAANPLTGAIGNVVGTSSIRPGNPSDLSLRIEGQSGKFHYFLNAIEQDGGQAGYQNAAAAAALTYSGVGGTVYQQVTRDAIVKLNYDLSANDELETLFAYGTTTPSPEFEATINNGNQATFQPVPPFEFHSYDIESLEYTHRFSSDKGLTVRVWNFNSNPDQYLPTAADGYFVQNDIARSTGARIEYKEQLNAENKITAGGQYIYTSDFQEMSPIFPNPFAAVLGNADFAGANNQNPSLWLSDEWSPTSRLDFNFGVRWDEMIYQAPSTPAGYQTQANGLPFAMEGFSGFSPDATLNNPSDPDGIFTNCTPQFNVCSSKAILSPSFIQPRISASYRVTDDFTVKAGYGQFNTFAQDMNVFAVSNLCAAGTGVVTGTPCRVVGNEAYTTAGNLAETGSNYDLSFEYLMSQNSYIKVTPYYKSVNNALIYTYIPLAQAGGEINANLLTSKGVELQLHTQNWHGLTGTLNYTYNVSNIIGNPEYTFGLLPQFQTSSPITGAALTQTNALPNAAALYNQVNSASISPDWDIRHSLHLLLNYKLNDKWDIAPNFTFATGQPYGLGAAGLQSFYANLQAACAAPPSTNTFITPTTCAQDLPSNGNPNPLNEGLPNSLRSANFFIGNIAITYHASQALSATFSVYNLFNNNQIQAYNSTPYFPAFMGTFGYPNTQDYSPLLSQYAPSAVQTIRQYYLTTTYKF